METFFSILLALVGVGFLVFIHETGHFLAAKWCGVHVHVFSLGFGPRIAGFVRRGCEYRLSLVPVGGYVRMEGEIGDGDATDPAGSLSRKTPLQRIFVYSAGVLMNFLVAFVLFPVVYFWGVPVERPVVGYVQPGGPAWIAGILPGTVIRSVNGNPIDAFHDLPVEIALAGSPVKLQLSEPKPGFPDEYQEREVECNTVADPATSMPRLGVGSGRKSVLYTDLTGVKRLGFPVEVEEGSPAYEAGVRTGDFLVAAKGLPANFFDRSFFEDSLAGVDGGNVTWAFRCETPAGRAPELLQQLERGVSLTPRPIPGSERSILGINPAYSVVKNVRGGGVAERLSLRAKDQILTVQGALFVRASELVPLAAKPEIEILRDGVKLKLTAELAEPERWLLLTEVELDPMSTRAAVVSGLAGDLAGIRSGDRILRIGETDVNEWSDVQKAIANADGQELQVEYERSSALGDGAPGIERIQTKVKPTKAPHFEFGFRLQDDEVLFRAASPVDACVKGFAASVKFIKRIAFLLKKIALGDVPAKENLGGPISIAAQSFHEAQSGTVHFLNFLAILSLNLALINLLPIPVLDGGNLLFVIVEAVKGSPVSDRVLGASQMVGVFLLIALMVWVTFHDVRRVFGLFT